MGMYLRVVGRGEAEPQKFTRAYCEEYLIFLKMNKLPKVAYVHKSLKLTLAKLWLLGERSVSDAENSPYPDA